MTRLSVSLQFGTPECHRWRQAFFDGVTVWAEDLAAGFVHVAKRYGNAAGNRWLKRNAEGLVDPQRIYNRFAPIAADLKKAVAAIRNRGNTTIEGIQAASEWLAYVERSLVIGGFNCTQDDEALIDYATAHATAVENERARLIGSIAEHNRRLRLGLLPPPLELPPIKGDTASAQARHLAEVVAKSRNPLSPPPGGIPLIAVFRWQRAPVMSIAVADALALRKARSRAAVHGIEPPARTGSIASQLGRLSCSLWWRRKLRRLSGRRLEQIQREARRVHAQAGIYCSDMTVERRRSQKHRNHALLETLEAINQEGQTYTLAELAELGLANPDHRRAELMLRIRDTEVEARRLGHVGVFYTVTAPSRFHPVNANKYWNAKRKRYQYHCRRNRKYDGSTPREAQQYLQQVWARARAKLARDGLAIYGIRVVEPHHDGTPHWHLLVWMVPEHQARVTEVLQEYAEAESPEELYDRRGNKTTARFDVEEIDYNKGTAAGYVAKYISKNINGEQFTRTGIEGDDKDLYERSLTEVAPRIEAWAATWGIRQFQFLGLPSVTVWREVRRLTEKQEHQLQEWEACTRPEPTAAERFHAIRRAANAGEWAIFLRLMGGPCTKRKDQPVKPWRLMAQDPAGDGISHGTGEIRQGIDVLGRYGDPVQVTKGLVVKGRYGVDAEYLTRLYSWEVRSKDRTPAASTPGRGEAAAPWTCVTNCTGVDLTPRNPFPESPDAEVLAAQIRRFEEWRSSEEVRAEMDDVDFETRAAQAAAKRLIQHDATARRVLAERGIYIEAPPFEPEEFYPPELC
ncbi:replication endonuclease [Billgrantia montanilacus]|uniref:Replication endonuclease n=1 Tax=Billgrantia montanilacus TaxID=2282305 RepID=A0A368TZC8_9GAMM|nr:replication endonuclease [Halomonas montanilacus]RCV89696.1 replication endonuclease [Halomonas montanilacus]